MADLKLILGDIQTKITLGQSVNSIIKILGRDCEYTTYNDLPDHEYVTYKDLGLEFLFKKDELSSAFLYIEHEDYDLFDGEFGFFDHQFFKNPDPKIFYHTAVTNGYVEWSSSRKTSINMIKGDIHLLYTFSPHRGKFITFNSPSKLFESLSKRPFDKKTQLIQMKKRFDEVMSTYRIDEKSALKYEEKCLDLVTKIENMKA